MENQTSGLMQELTQSVNAANERFLIKFDTL